MSTTIFSRSAGETLRFGRVVGRWLKGGEVIGLTGDLGGGKTTFVRGLLGAFGVRAVTSPTFVLVKHYPSHRQGIRQVVHADLFRLEPGVKLNDLGLAEVWGQPDTVVLVEWFDRLRQRPANAQELRFRILRPSWRAIEVPRSLGDGLRPGVARRALPPAHSRSR